MTVELEIKGVMLSVPPPTSSWKKDEWRKLRG